MDNAEPMRFNVADIQTQMTLGGGVLKGGILVVDPNGLLVAYGHYARLKAEVERLRKSGDQMATVLSDLLQSDLIPCSISRGVIKSTLDKWNAAPK